MVQQEEKYLVQRGREEGKDTFKWQREEFSPGRRFGGALFPPCEGSWKNGMNLWEKGAEKEPGEGEEKQTKKCDQEAFC